MTTPLSVGRALGNAARQSRNGPTFGVNECKQRVRELYGVPSDGSPDATRAWQRTKHRHPIGDLKAIPPGALVWWTGGTPSGSAPDGHGHVAPVAGNGMCWSTDIKRDGRFDLVSIASIAAAWPRLRLAGWSEDIDGVRVLTVEKPKPGRYAAARDLLLTLAADQRLGKAKRRRARAAARILRKEPTQ
ncbi:hypothetical protein [Nocardioides sp. InS609-2]|uniref:hypothetical protein n=1 Tax=Nocardioides sp. InS609-2 TaxID=2760705 RepID=UPI0020BFB3F9|nr:hypothetical protein [Nocardioides sp. InS609-2]